MSNSLLSHIPIKKYKLSHYLENGVTYPQIIESEQGDLIKSEDLETLLNKLANPQVLKKVINAFMFGQSIKWDEILKD